MRFELYEDGAGGLHLYDVARGVMYSNMEMSGSSPLTDAAMLAYAEDTASSWTVPMHSVAPEEIGDDERLILAIEFPGAPTYPPGRSGQEALGISNVI